MSEYADFVSDDGEYLISRDEYFSSELPWTVYRLYGRARSFAAAYANEDEARALAKARGERSE